MVDKPRKKQLVIYGIIFVIITLLVILLAQRSTTDYQEIPNYGRSNNIDFEAKSTVPAMMEDAVMQETERDSSVTTSEVGQIEIAEKKVIKIGEITMHVNSIENALKEIRSIAVSYGGDEISSDFSKNTIKKSGMITVKVPADQYDQALEAVKKISPLVVRESTNAQDVTAQFIDLESRIKNKKDHETRLRTFFDRAEDVDELIQVERELSRVRTEIEQMESQLKYLSEQTQFSTMYITLYEDEDVVVSNAWRPLQVVKDSFNTLLHRSTDLIDSTIRFVIIVLPFILLFALVAWILYRTSKRIFKK